jgi:hypothetical protein
VLVLHYLPLITTVLRRGVLITPLPSIRPHQAVGFLIAGTLSWLPQCTRKRSWRDKVTLAVFPASNQLSELLQLQELAVARATASA